jgi:hypothetical protein
MSFSGNPPPACMDSYQYAGRVEPHKISFCWKSEGLCAQRSRVYGERLAEVEEYKTGLQGRRTRDKQEKFESLKQVFPSWTKSLPMASLASRTNLFFFGNTTNQQDRGEMETDFTPLQTTDIASDSGGCYLLDDGGTVVFLLLPRAEVLESNGKAVFEDIKALNKLQEGKGSTARAPQRTGIFDGNYSTIGVRANRGAHGTIDCLFSKKQEFEHQWNRIVRMIRRCESAAASYLPSGILRALNTVIEMAKCPTMCTTSLGEKGKATSMFPAMATAINHCTPAHTDEDIWFSMLTVNVVGLVTPNSRYKLDAPVVHHFVFPSLGVSVALRPGDILIFNPNVYHCLAHKEHCYNDKKVFATSLYIKTSVICKNDNRIPLTQEEKDIQAVAL